MTIVPIVILAALVLVIAVLLVAGFCYDGFASGNVAHIILTALSILIASIPIALPLVL